MFIFDTFRFTIILAPPTVFHAYLLKCGAIWNNLKQPETTHNEQETIWNNLQRPEATYNEQESTYNDLILPTMTKKEAQRPTASILWDYFTMWGNWFSSLIVFHPTFDCNHSSIASWRIMVKIESVQNICMLSCIFITVYRICRVCCQLL